MQTLTSAQLAQLHARSNHLQVSREPAAGGGYNYAVNGVAVDYATFCTAVELIRHPEALAEVVESLIDAQEIQD